ncbi:hypothetical protein [Yinghuangia seranimata]|uniref:hypothetical protein n=1 Tax=Yinghuangia seranimata TaxID=408067 RepID=UPI00248AC2E3|nr:hypothetical protein [Yinghuangia seranimata]MDI2129924.1 hypothetical protein [Yinghuangia seranimata]
MTETRDEGRQIRVRKGRRELVADDSVIAVGDEVFRLDELDRVSYWAAARINQATYQIGLASGERKQVFMWDAYRRGTEMADSRANWLRLVARLEGTACPRIAAAALHEIEDGATITFGSTASERIDTNSEGLRFRRWLAKPIDWAAVSHADMHEGQVRVWLTGAAKPKYGIGTTGWNAVVLPRVIRALAAGEPPRSG